MCVYENSSILEMRGKKMLRDVPNIKRYLFMLSLIYNIKGVVPEI